MKIKTAKGFVVEGALVIGLLLGMVALFVPNPVSNTLGIGVRPNKTVMKDSYKETVELLKDKDGNIIGQKTIASSATSDVDQQQHVTFWQSLVSLPRLFLLFIILGACGVPGFAWVGKVYGDLKRAYTQHREDTKKIVVGLDRAFATVPLTLAGFKLAGEIDRAALAKEIIDKMKAELGDYYNDSTKALVKSILRR